MRRPSAALVAAILLASCAEMSKLPPGADVGPRPVIAEPRTSWLPTLQVAPAVGWPAGRRPIAAPGLAVTEFASGLEHPRWLHVLPNGDVLVAESDAPERHDGGGGFKALAMKAVMKIAGSASKSADRITLLRDADGDGVAEVREPFITGLHSPFGMALVGDALYVANTDAIVRFAYRPGATRVEGGGTKVVELPAEPLNHHWTKSLVASPDGRKLYVGVGSNSNVAENGLEVEAGRAAVWEVDVASGSKRLFATGLRNPVGLAFAPDTRKLWAVVNERDELGSDLVPDLFTRVVDGAFYGWPWAYFGRVDARVQPPDADAAKRMRMPDYALGSHVAPLGLAFSEGLQWPAPFGAGAFIGQHGSWNRRPPNGYNVVFIPFDGASPSGKPVIVLDGFLSEDTKAYGRPVGVAVDRCNGLLVADDVGGKVWRLAPR